MTKILRRGLIPLLLLCLLLPVLASAQNCLPDVPDIAKKPFGPYVKAPAEYGSIWCRVWWANPEPWKQYAPAVHVDPAPAGFYEIFSLNRGPLTGAEVRQAEELTGIEIDDSTAVRAYNTKQLADKSFYGGELLMSDLQERLSPADYNRLQIVHAWVTKMLGAEPIYFEWKTDKVTAELDVSVVEGIRHVGAFEAEKVSVISVAFPGQHALVRDVFDLTQYLGGWPNPLAEGRRAMQLPGRDRWARLDGAGAFTTYLISPVEVLSRIQMRQLEQGREVTMARSPIVPPEMWGWLPTP